MSDDSCGPMLPLLMFSVASVEPYMHTTIWSGSWADRRYLIQACCVCMCSPADAAACVAASSLKHMLNSQDALLGPWLPGRDMLEDELRTFVGECRAMHIPSEFYQVGMLSCLHTVGQCRRAGQHSLCSLFSRQLLAVQMACIGLAVL